MSSARYSIGIQFPWNNLPAVSICLRQNVLRCSERGYRLVAVPVIVEKGLPFVPLFMPTAVNAPVSGLIR